MKINGFLIVLGFLLVLASVSFAAEKIVYVENEGGSYPYFCNPCWITYSNSSHSIKGRINNGDYFFSFNGTSSNYTIDVRLQMLGFNISTATYQMPASSSSVYVDTGISRKGDVAYVINSNSNVFYPYTTNNEGSYSYNFLFNLTRALGYSGLNGYNAYGNYSFSDSVSPTAFNAYDLVMVSGLYSSTMVGSMSTAIKNAEAYGVPIVISADRFGSLGAPGSSLVNYTAGSFTVQNPISYAEGGALVDGTKPYPLGYDIYSSPSRYEYVYTGGGIQTGGGRKWWFESGEQDSYITYFSRAGSPGLHILISEPMISKYGNYHIVPKLWATSLAGWTFDHSPTLLSMTYLTLLDYNLGTDTLPTAFNIKALPLLPGNNTNITCSYTYYDEDGDLENGTTFAWYRNNTLTSWDNQTLTSNNTQIGETWYCKVRPVNDEGYGFWTQSLNNVTIYSNAAPIASNVAISPSSPPASQNLACTYIYSDEENNPENASTFRWYKNGVVISGITTQTLSSGNTDTGDVILCEVTPRAFSGTKVGTPVNSSNTTILERTSAPSSGSGGGVPIGEEDAEILCTNECPPGFIRLDYAHGCTCVEDTICTNECPYNLRLSYEQGCACVADLLCINNCPPGLFRTNFPECACIDQVVQGDDFKITPVYDDVFLGEIPLPCQAFGEVCCDYVITNIVSYPIGVGFSSEIPRYGENLFIRTSEGVVDEIELGEAERVEFSLCIENLRPGESFNTDVIADSGRAIKRINVYSNPPLLLTSYGGFPLWGWILALVLIAVIGVIWHLYNRRKRNKGLRRGSKSYNVFYRAPAKPDDTFTVLILAFVVIVIIAIVMFI